MLFQTSGQWLVFLACVYTGAALVVVYKAINAVRAAYSDGFIAHALCDALFCAIACAAALATIIYKANGEIRVYMLLGVAAGFFAFKLIWERIAFYAGKRLDERRNKAEKEKKP